GARRVGGVVTARHRLRIAVHHHGLVAERAKALRGVEAAVVELEALADAVRAGPEDHGARRVAAGRRFVGLAPGGVVVRRRRLDLAGARIDTAVHRAHAAGAAPRPDVILGRRAARADLGIGPALTLESQEIVCDQIVEPAHVELAGQLTVEPRVCALVERPGFPTVQLPRPLRLAKRLDEGAADSHRLADRLHLRAERRVGAGKFLERETRKLDDDVV